MYDYIFGVLYVTCFIGGLLFFLAIGDIIMSLLLRIPFLKKKFDDLYDSLPMSDEDW